MHITISHPGTITDHLISYNHDLTDNFNDHFSTSMKQVITATLSVTSRCLYQQWIKWFS